MSIPIPLWIRSKRLPNVVAVGLTLTAMLVSLATQPLAAQQQGPHSATRVLTTVDDWRAGSLQSLLVSNNEQGPNGGELRLNDTALSGVFVSAPLDISFSANAVGAVWRADVPANTSISLELRGRGEPITATLSPEEGWSEWLPLNSGDARSQVEDGAFAVADPVAFPTGARLIQVRIVFNSSVQRASAILSSLDVISFDSRSGPSNLAPDSAGSFAAPDVLTPRPPAVRRVDWSGLVPDANPPALPPRGIILHQLHLPSDGDVPTYLRSLEAYQHHTLGWDDLAYHYLIATDGTLYEGRIGGPISSVSRLSGGDTAIHIALLDEPNAAMKDRLVDLLAWLGQAYKIPLTGSHDVVNAGVRTTRANLAGHHDIAPEAIDPGQLWLDAMGESRAHADQRTVRSRWYLVEGNPRDYQDRITLLNPSDSPTNATIRFLRDRDGVRAARGDQVMTRIVPVPANGRAEIAVNTILSTTNTLPAIVEGNVPLLVERNLALPGDDSAAMGVDRLARLWYFAEGSTYGDAQTFLLLYNPLPNISVDVTLTLLPENGGERRDVTLTIPPAQRSVVTLADLMPNARFGMRVSASQPIAAERTVRFGPNGSGIHRAPGISQLSRTWHFAEGTTQEPFQTMFLLLNPNSQTANANLTFMTSEGITVTQRYALPPFTRLSVDAAEMVAPGGFATMISADRPIVAEREMLFRTQSMSRPGSSLVVPTIVPGEVPPDASPDAGTITPGAPQTAFNWRFVGAATGDNTIYLLISNPNARTAVVTMEVIGNNGIARSVSVTVPAQSRSTLPVHDYAAGQNGVSVHVMSTQPIAAELSIFRGGGTRGGSTVSGVPEGQ